MDIPHSLKPAPPSALELAKREYHAATIAMGELDAKVIDAAATLDELKKAYGASIIRVNEARDKLVEARTPAAEPAIAIDPNLAFLDDLDRDLNGQGREYALERVSDADQQRLSVIIRSGSPLTQRAGAILQFLAGGETAEAREAAAQTAAV